MADDLRERRRLFDEEIVNRHDLEAIPKWFAPDFVDHVEVPGMPPGVEGVRARHQMLFTAMPDIRIVVEEVVVGRPVGRPGDIGRVRAAEIACFHPRLRRDRCRQRDGRPILCPARPQ